ncbi:hypothetical protein JK364_48965 [Streptomyces sp. 110]|uniref:Uncharacterized protein n=1 Tax=Streptomyces endocoffeicus TaxID=2898945 RepID=A0ABS1Q741_9ACTN|nr:hypothetical protein [Streptomyces endocoffeicus]MBL1120174.1 hypothetical protein [Streptomyces endocoffeicus]
MAHDRYDAALQTLTTGVDSFSGHLQDSGELHDPCYGEPTQYGTAYHAYGNAVLALLGPSQLRSDHRDRAIRGIAAALAHTADHALPAVASGFDRITGSVTDRVNHRDFTWPPILKTLRLLPRIRAEDDTVRTLREQVAAVDVRKSFTFGPPHNWAAVWLHGEWIRYREGLSPHTLGDLDRLLAVFFEERIDLDLGFYAEPGLPNSYDLFARGHLVAILADGYDGAHRPALVRLLETGLRRSLDIQLSDGSMASAHRSTGQSWTVGQQAAFFSLAAGWFAGEGDDPELAGAARGAADRAVRLLGTRQRPGGPFSAVDNLLPASHRVGYEFYTADAHYSSLALAFLADALMDGYGAPAWTEQPAPALETRRAVRIEGAPLFRAVAHRGPVSVHLDGDPADSYDTFGLADLTFGPGRTLGFGVAKASAGEGRASIGLALRPSTGRQPLEVLSARPHTPSVPTSEPDRTLVLDSSIPATDELPARRHRISVTLLPDGPTGVAVEESVPGADAHPTLLIPYPADTGAPDRTAVERLPDGIRLRMADETVEVRVDGGITDIIVIPAGWEGRRGLYGLARLDLPGPADTVHYRITATSSPAGT